MLSEVRISDVGVISAATLELGPGFTAITGETGAGKTMVLTGLSMLRGAKVDPALVRRGAARAVAEGQWTLLVGPGLADRVISRVLDAGGEVDDGELLVTRQVRQSGRSRSAIGGCAVPAAVLAEVVDQLIAVHGQNDQLRLGRSQLGLLDRWAGTRLEAPRRSYQIGYDQFSELVRELNDLREAAAQRGARAEFLEYQLAQIDRIRPQPGEDVALAATAARLGHAEVLQSAVNRALTLLRGDEAVDNAVDVMGLLSDARRAVDSVREHDPDLNGPSQSIREAGALISDAAAELGAYAAGLESDPGQLGAVEARRAELGRLIGRYGANVDEVLSWEAAAAAELAELGQVEVNIAAREVQLQELRNQLAPLAQQCHDIRRQAAAEFGEAVTAELAALAMPHARVVMELTADADPDGLGITIAGKSGCWRFNRNGCDDAVIMLVAGPGAPKRPVALGASGGELSRIMLAIHVVLADADPVPTVVFDEIDAGVGGAAALEVGRRLAKLARTTQVLAVTHLAQVAAYADQHLVVTRTSADLVVESSVVAVSGQERVREIARMLSGQPEAGAALAHAQELLTSARAETG